MIVTLNVYVPRKIFLCSIYVQSTILNINIW